MGESAGVDRRSPSVLLRRIAARFLDLAAVIALAFLLARVLTPLLRPRDWADTSEVRFVLLLFGIPLVAMAYEAVLVAWRGRTLGKTATGVRVQRLDGARPGVARATVRALRWLLLLVPVVLLPLLSIVYLWALFTRDGRGLHDLLAGTNVVPTAPAPNRSPAPGHGQDAGVHHGPGLR
jgi:uncharacterized RDD family membrane protein YckC